MSVVKFSAVFRCHKRPNLTELCLRRIVEILRDHDHELILLYDGDNPDYLARMEDITHFAAVVTNPDGKLVHGKLLNVAYSQCGGPLFVHLENDYYWIKPCMNEALEAVQHVDTVRLTMFPFSINNCRDVIELKDGAVGVFKDKTGFKFSLNPHIRKERFPVGQFGSLKVWAEEMDYAMRYDVSGKTGGCLMNDNFIHLGLYNSKGGFSVQHAMYFLGRKWKERIDELDPVKTFNNLTNNEFYRELFRQYLIDHGGEKYV